MADDLHRARNRRPPPLSSFPFLVREKSCAVSHTGCIERLERVQTRAGGLQYPHSPLEHDPLSGHVTKALRRPPFLLLLPSLPLVSGTCWGKNICAVALLSARVCHPFAGAMLIFSVSFQFYLVPSRRRARRKEPAKRPKGPEERASVLVLWLISPNSGICGLVGFSDALRGVPGRLGHLTGC